MDTFYVSLNHSLAISYLVSLFHSHLSTHKQTAAHPHMHTLYAIFAYSICANAYLIKTNALQCFSKCFFISTSWMWKLSPFTPVDNSYTTSYERFASMWWGVGGVNFSKVSDNFICDEEDEEKQKMKKELCACVCMYSILYTNIFFGQTR